MYKFIIFLLVLIIAPILGGVYGILHDQITYSISPEYYTKFKFIQFDLENYWGLGINIGSEIQPEMKLQSPRFGASIVGLLATWWVGMILGIIFGLIGLIHKTAKMMFTSIMKAFLLTIGIALFTGILGLGYGKLFLIENLGGRNIPEHIIDIDHFVMVGSMHNFSYLGGLIGLIIGGIYIITQKKKFVKQLKL